MSIASQRPTIANSGSTARLGEQVFGPHSIGALGYPISRPARRHPPGRRQFAPSRGRPRKRGPWSSKQPMRPPVRPDSPVGCLLSACFMPAACVMPRKARVGTNLPSEGPGTRMWLPSIHSAGAVSRLVCRFQVSGNRFASAIGSALAHLLRGTGSRSTRSMVSGASCSPVPPVGALVRSRSLLTHRDS